MARRAVSGKEAFQVGRKGLGGGIAVAGLLLDRLEDDPLQVAQGLSGSILRGRGGAFF